MVGSVHSISLARCKDASDSEKGHEILVKDRFIDLNVCHLVHIRQVLRQNSESRP